VDIPAGFPNVIAPKNIASELTSDISKLTSQLAPKHATWWESWLSTLPLPSIVVTEGKR
jgi:hypothetical protein